MLRSSVPAAAAGLALLALCSGAARASMPAARGTITIPAAVAVSGGPGSDPAAVAVVTQALRAAGVRTDAHEARFTVVVGGGGPRHPEGYALRIRSRSISLAGSDPAGQYYASLALRSLLAGGRRVAAGTFESWPTLAVRGIVEGFYGTPWPHDETLRMLDFAAAHRLNTFTYMPKADAFLRSQWRTPYPASALRRLGELVQRARREHIRFGVGISPGDSICFSSRADRRALLAKLEQLWAVGVRSFVVAFDDVNAKRVPCEADREAFGTSDAARGAEQASLVNVVDTWQRGRAGADRLAAVPSEYAGDDSTPLKRAFAKDVRPDVLVEWTGPFGVSETLSRADVAAGQRNYRHDLVLWDNHYVNDYATGYLVLGPLAGLPADPPAALRGVVADPMPQAESSKIGLACIAAYAWSPRAYDSARCWHASLRELAAGAGRAAYGALETFADANYAPPLGSVQAPTLTRAVAAFWQGWNAGDVNAAAPLRAQLAKLAAAPETLRRTLPNARFVAEAGPWLDATRLWAEAAVSALDSMVSYRHGDQASYAAETSSARALRMQAQGLTQPSAKGPQPLAPASGVVDPFVHDALRGYGP